MPPNCELVPQASALRLAIQRALTTANLKYSLFAIICYVTLYLRKVFHTSAKDMSCHRDDAGC
jgi:hypothetical protein